MSFTRALKRLLYHLENRVSTRPAPRDVDNADFSSAFTYTSLGRRVGRVLLQRLARRENYTLLNACIDL